MASIDGKKVRRKKVRKTKTGAATVIDESEKSETFHDAVAESHVDVDHENYEVTGTTSVKSLSPVDQLINESDDVSDPMRAMDVVHCNENGEMLDIDNNNHSHSSSPEADSLTSNPYLNREKCLLCQRDRTPDDESDSEDEELKIGPHNYALSQMSLWVCAKCKATLEEEERKGMMEPSFLNEEVETDPNALKVLQEMQMYGRGMVPGGATEASLTSCCCEACKDRRQIEQEQDEENTRLQHCWVELLHAIRYIYRDSKKSLPENGGTLDKAKQKQHVSRLCARDCHQLFQRLESHAVDYILEVKVRLLQQLTSGHGSPEQAKDFMSLMLEEYGSLCVSAKILTDIFKQLEKEHLNRFTLNWELHDKHLFQNVIYSDPVVRTSIPMLITQLRLGAASKEACAEDSYPSLLHKYLKFDDEMSVVAVVWRECQARIDQYNDEQAAIQAKQRMLREDWEFFSAQRKILKEQIMKNHQKTTRFPNITEAADSTSSCSPLTVCSESIYTSVSSSGNNKCLESQFSDAMRNLLDSTSSVREPFTCPNCKRQRCPCHECSISHLITCGLLAPELQDSLLPITAPDGSCGASTNPFTITPSSIGYDLSVKAPSFSSADSSSSEADSEALTTSTTSPNSLDDKLDGKSGRNLFDEFLIEHSREKPTLKNLTSLKAELDSIAPNDLSEPPQCQCHECKKPLCSNNSILGNESIVDPPSTTTTTTTSRLPGTPSTNVPFANIPKPAALHLYPHIHGSKAMAGSMDTSRIGAAHLAAGGSLSAAQYKSILQPQLYNLHSNPLHPQSQLVKDHHDKLKQQKRETSAFSPPFSGGNLQRCVKDQLKARHACSASSDASNPLYNPLSGIDAAPAFSSFSAYTNYKFPDVTSYSTNTTRINTSDLLTAPPPPFNPSAFSLDSTLTANVPHVTNNATRATKLHSWQMMTKQVQPSCLLAYPNAADGDNPHEHTEECFKHLHGPINHSSAIPSLNAKGCTKVELDLYNKLAGCFASAASTGGVSTTGNQHHATTNHAHSVTSCSTRSTQHESVTTHASAKTSVSNCQHTPSNKAKVSAASSKPHVQAKSNQKPDRLNNSHSVSTSLASEHSGETEGGGSPVNSDDEDGDSCSGQSSSTSTSNQKDSKYCDCCYCEFFGHGQPAPAPTSKNYAEIRERLRLRLKKKQKQNPCSKGHDLVPISTLNSIAASTPGFKPAVSTPSVKSGILATQTCADTDHTALSTVPESKEEKSQSAPAPASRPPPTDYPDVEELVKYITGEAVNTVETPKPDKKQRKKQKKAEQKAKRLEQAKQLPRADGSTSVANSDSDGDSDSDKIIAQLQTKSSRHKQAKPSRSKEKSAATMAPVNSLEEEESGKGKIDLKGGSPSLQRSESTAHQQQPPTTHLGDSQRSKTTKLSSNTNNSSNTSNVSTSSSVLAPRRDQLNNLKTPTKYEPLAERRHQRTHNNLQTSEPTDVKQQRRSEKKGGVDKRKGDNLIENQGKESSSADPQFSDKHTNLLNAKNSPGPAKEKSAANQRQQPEGEEDSTMQQRRNNRNNNQRSSPGSNQQGKRKGAKGETTVDDVFMPKDDEDVEEHDDFEKELNEFKRFVMSTPAPKDKMAVNVNLKDLQLNKKKGLTC